MKWGGYRQPDAKKKRKPSSWSPTPMIVIILARSWPPGKPDDECSAARATSPSALDRSWNAKTRRLIARLQALGHHVTLQPAAGLTTGPANPVFR